MNSRLADAPSQHGAYDTQDVRLPVSVGQLDLSGGSAPTRRARSGGANTTLLLLVGVGLGRYGLGILNDATLALVDPVIPVALAAIGVIAAFEIATMSWVGGRAVAGATLQAVIAGGLVAAGILGFVQFTAESIAGPAWITAIVLAVCASPSSAIAVSGASQRSSIARIVDIDALVPMLAGGIAIVAIQQRALLPAASIVGQAAAIAITVGIVGWLLLTRTELDTEQRVFGTSTLLLLGGVADYLSASALMAGLLAGAFWHIVGGAPRESLRRDLAHLQQPLVALVLLVAGARTELTTAAATLAVAYVLLRGAGKLAGSLVLRRMVPALGRSAAPHLLFPGVLGVAFALNAARGGGADMSLVLSAAVLGTIGAQLLAGAPPGEEGA